MIKDSGLRTEFETGAVRDMQEGKADCSLLPLDVINKAFYDGDDEILNSLAGYQDTLNITNIEWAMIIFVRDECNKCIGTAILELSKHYTEGMKKYERDNWRKGIPCSSYLSSAIRHYLKFKRGDTDERHDRAFLWNLMCLYWTAINKPEMQDLKPIDSYKSGECEKFVADFMKG